MVSVASDGTPRGPKRLVCALTRDWLLLDLHGCTEYRKKEEWNKKRSKNWDIVLCIQLLHCTNVSMQMRCSYLTIHYRVDSVSIGGCTHHQILFSSIISLNWTIHSINVYYVSMSSILYLRQCSKHYSQLEWITHADDDIAQTSRLLTWMDNVLTSKHYAEASVTQWLAERPFHLPDLTHLGSPAAVKDSS